MNDSLARVVDSAFAAAREGRADDDRDFGLLVLLLRRYRRGGDDPIIAEMYGEDAAAIPVTTGDVGDVLRRVLDEIAEEPWLAGWYAPAVSAPEDEQSVPAVLAVLDRYRPPLTWRGENDVCSLLWSLGMNMKNAAARAALERWASHPGSPGDEAREALAREQRVRFRWWRLGALVDDAAAALRTGYGGAPAVQSLRWLFRRANAARRGEPFDEERDLRFRLSWEKALRITHRLWQGTPPGLVTTQALIEVMTDMASEETVPYLLELLLRNEERFGSSANAADDDLVTALTPFAGRPEVARALEEHADRLRRLPHNTRVNVDFNKGGGSWVPPDPLTMRELAAHGIELRPGLRLGVFDFDELDEPGVRDDLIADVVVEHAEDGEGFVFRIIDGSTCHESECRWPRDFAERQAYEGPPAGEA